MEFRITRVQCVAVVVVLVVVVVVVLGGGGGGGGVGVVGVVAVGDSEVFWVAVNAARVNSESGSLLIELYYY